AINSSDEPDPPLGHTTPDRVVLGNGVHPNERPRRHINRAHHAAHPARRPGTFATSSDETTPNDPALLQDRELLVGQTQQGPQDLIGVLPEERRVPAMPSPLMERERHGHSRIPLSAYDGMIKSLPEPPRIHLDVTVDRVCVYDRLCRYAGSS